MLQIHPPQNPDVPISNVRASFSKQQEGHLNEAATIPPRIKYKNTKDGINFCAKITDKKCQD